MKKKKDTVLVVLVGGVSDEQAMNICKDVVLSKRKHAPGARGTAGCVDEKRVGNFLQGAWQKFIEEKKT